MTEAEKLIWQNVRNKQLGHRFNRQIIIENKYIVDFYCAGKVLILEIDGGQHNDNASDKIRDAFLQERGYKVLRFWNNEVLGNLEGCLWQIRQILNN